MPKSKNGGGGEDKESPKPTRGRGIYIPDDEYEEIMRETIQAAMVTGRPVSVSAWMRQAAREKIERDRASRGRKQELAS